MDAILGPRPTSSPVALVHSGGDDVSQVPSGALNGIMVASACVLSCILKYLYTVR